MRPGQAAWFCDEVLTLHPSILKVFMLEKRADRFLVVEEAARPDVGPIASDIRQFLAGRSLNPALVLGDPADSQVGLPKLLGVLYGNENIMFTRLSPQSILAVCAEPSGFEAALQTVNRTLPALLEREADLPPRSNMMSAAEAIEIARNYVASVARTPDICIDEATLNETSGKWNIQGSYRPNPFARSRSFQLQLGAEKGPIIGFASPARQPLAPLLAGLGVILGTLFVLVWIILLNR